jgi:hypothetical protein
MSGFIKTCLIACLLISWASAQDKDNVRFELSPHTGFMDGSGQFGLDASMNYKAFNLEFSAAQVIGETADLYPLNVNLLFNLAKKGQMIPYGGVGVGLLLTVPSTTIGNKTLSSLGLNFGGGLRFYFTDDFGLRLGVNQFLTNIKSKRDASEELLIFQEVTIGVIFVFN